jgi:peroxiredoxin
MSVERQMSTPASREVCSLARHSPAQVAFHMVGSGGYIGAKWCLSPVFYVARQAGWKGQWPRRLDAKINRTVMPMTESPDDRARCDVTPTLRRGDPIPDVPVRLADGTSRSIRSFADRPLLLVPVRGSWCPYSRLHLADLTAALPRLEAANVRVLAVSSHPDADLWQAWGVRVPVVADPDGALFRALGVRVQHWMDTAWGRVLPYESAFLFDASGRLVAADVRRVSSYRMRQTFLSSEEWLRIVHQQKMEASS